VLRYYCREAAAADEQERRGEERETQTGEVPVMKSSINSSHLSHLPLPISSEGYVSLDDIPLCENCGEKRTFEFQVSSTSLRSTPPLPVTHHTHHTLQVMPQLLHYLQVDANTRLGQLSNDETITSSSNVFCNLTHEVSFHHPVAPPPSISCSISLALYSTLLGH
jgi:hypothetical protein